MKTLLRIEASLRTQGSRTRALSDYFEQLWLEANPGATVVQRCLAKEPIPHLDQASFERFAEDNRGCTLSDVLINELKQADHLLLASPLYNLSLPSGLKAYFDHVVRSSQTFQLNDGKHKGLLNNTRATILTACGDSASADFQRDYLIEILRFIGIDETHAISVAGEVEPGDSMVIARQQIKALFDNQAAPRWQGHFSKKDREAIDRLRLAQADAIERGSARRYGELCASDIQLMIPAYPPLHGKQAFLKAEENLFKSTSFKRFVKLPAVIERSGDLAVETGMQHVELDDALLEGREGVKAAKQKYTHVYRKTPEGWRFCVLMSNAVE